MNLREQLKAVKPILESENIESLHSKYTSYKHSDPESQFVHLIRDIIEEKTLDLYKDIFQ